MFIGSFTISAKGVGVSPGEQSERRFQPSAAKGAHQSGEQFIQHYLRAYQTSVARLIRDKIDREC